MVLRTTLVCPKRHLGRFSRFCRANTQADRRTTVLRQDSRIGIAHVYALRAIRANIAHVLYCNISGHLTGLVLLLINWLADLLSHSWQKCIERRVSFKIRCATKKQQSHPIFGSVQSVQNIKHSCRMLSRKSCGTLPKTTRLNGRKDARMETIYDANHPTTQQVLHRAKHDSQTIIIHNAKPIAY